MDLLREHGFSINAALKKYIKVKIHSLVLSWLYQVTPGGIQFLFYLYTVYKEYTTFVINGRFSSNTDEVNVSIKAYVFEKSS